ncbi:hypothetical protein HNQ57_001364 [Zhongshania antarctica]|uniref:Uncharacterized protein n=1 Tax=Zhongshania antarctica TaxID=641702 RepID=A0A840R3X8_9GAMM|nr:hypothetical protein [Zhongshania antarctica]MBB5187101.1 hypothetical protein [Zhongshania antarctica]
MIRILSKLLTGSALFLLVACGGDDSGRKLWDPDPTWDNVGDAVRATDISMTTNYAKVKSETFGAVTDRVKRWDVDPASNKFIPVQINGVSFVEEALDIIEEKLGRQLFDRESLVGVDPASINYGLIFREGTARGPGDEADGINCGHVGAKDSSVSYEPDWYDETGAPQVALSVNIGSPTVEGRSCTVSLGLVIHEIFHALGKNLHYEGFGESPRGVPLNHQNRIAYTTLYNIYFHDLLTHKDDIVLQFPFGQEAADAEIEGRVGIGYNP